MLGGRRLIGVYLALILLAAVYVGAALVGNDSSSAPSVDVIMAPPIQTAQVTRGDIEVEHEFTGSVSFGDEWPLNTPITGTVTEHPERGHIVQPGEVILKVDDKPLFLAHGEMPLYRELYRVSTSRRDQLLQGADVTQLQKFLASAGYDDEERMDIDGVFDRATERAVEEWQDAVGLDDTGRVDASQLVFNPGPIRITSWQRVGTILQPPTVTEAVAKIEVDTSNQDRGALEVGSQVTLELPDDQEVPATITDQEQVIRADGSTVWRTTIRPDTDIPGDLTSVTVTATESLAQDVLIAPVTALLALSEGGFAVELVESGPNDNRTADNTDNSASGSDDLEPMSTRLIPVEVGAVLDGKAEVEGKIGEGDTIVVAT